MEQPITTKNVGHPCVICGQAADAQATIAALQADKGKLYEERNRMKDMLDRIAAIPEVDEGYHAPNEECIADGVEALVDEYHDCKQQLTQRTAELEAAKQKAAEQGRYAVEMFDELKRVQAELEMVKASARIWETQATNWQTVNAERCAELERVRGERDEAISKVDKWRDKWLERGAELVKPCEQCGHSSFDPTQRVVQSQHRQGMEG